MMAEDPCFLCTLPDCDENSSRCMVRQLNRRYEAKRQRGEVHCATPLERTASNEAFQIWHQERMAQAAEGARPYKRWKGDARS